ncbi:MAG: Adenine deaminase [Haliscomenobacter sp.]|nr:Adenine deaminase [Haliscomenobacter sp.]
MGLLNLFKMKRFAGILCFSLLAWLSVGEAWGQATAPEVAFVNVSVIPMTGKRVLRNQTVLVRGPVVYKIGPAKKIKPIDGALVIDGTGKYLMPGISEMHAHIPVPAGENDELVRETLLLYLSNGITIIRGMLGDPYHLALQDKISTGKVLGPRIYTSSPSLNGNTVKTPEEAQQKVAQYKKEGYDFLKIHPGITLPVMEALVQTAREAGIPFAGHVPVEVGVRKAIEMGYASIDHLDGFVEGLVPESAHPDFAQSGLFGYNFTNLADSRRIPELVKAVKKAGVWIVPTQSLLAQWTSPMSGVEMTNLPEMRYMASATLVQWRTAKQQQLQNPRFNADTSKTYIALRQRILREMEKQKVGLLLGSDAPQVGNVPGLSIQREMQALSEAGLSNYTILKSGTANPARFFGVEGVYGTIVRGATADLLLLEGNPLEDIRQMERIAGVMSQGRWISKGWLAQRLAIIEAKYR